MLEQSNIKLMMSGLGIGLRTNRKLDYFSMSETRGRHEGSRWILDHLNPIKVIDFPCEVADVIEVEKKFFILLKQSIDGTTPDPSLLCFDDCGNRLWSAESPSKQADLPYHKKSFFSSICQFDSKSLYARAKSTDYWIDIKNGKIIRSEWTK